MNRKWQTARATLLGLSLLLAACGSGKETDVITLRVGDQGKALQTILAAAGEDQAEGYRIVWSNHVGGPSVIAAQTGGSVDVGWMGETPLVFSQAAGSPVKVVAVRQGLDQTSAAVAIVVSADSTITSIAGLKGKRVGYSPGTITQYLVANELDKAGLSLGDIESVQLTSFNIANLDNGTVDAATIVQPNLSQLLTEGRIRVLTYGDNLYYLTASHSALADPGRADAIGDFAARVARATRWQRENVEEAIPVVTRVYGVTPEVARHMMISSPTHFVPIGDAAIERHQQEADLFYRLGLIRVRVDAEQLFDARFNPLIAEIEQ